MKRNFYWFLPLLVVLSIVLFYRKPQRFVDWNPHLNAGGKMPLGTYTLYQSLPDLFPGQTVQQKDEPLINYLKQINDPHLLILIYGSTDLGSADAELLLDFVGKGHHAFLSGNTFPHKLEMELHLETETRFRYAPPSDSLHKVVLHSTDSVFKTVHFNESIYFVPDSGQAADTLILNQDNETVEFIKVPYGKGYFYLHGQPYNLTNYSLLRYPEYPEIVMKQLPLMPVVWDEYYKPTKRVKGDSLAYVRHSNGLRQGFYLLLLATVLYFVFGGKRRQRIIPILGKPINRSLDFLKTISALFLQKGAHQDLAEKKWQHWKMDLRKRFHLQEQDPDFWKTLVSKTGWDARKAELLRSADEKRKRFRMSDSELVAFCHLIDDFYIHTSKYPSHERI